MNVYSRVSTETETTDHILNKYPGFATPRNEGRGGEGRGYPGFATPIGMKDSIDTEQMTSEAKQSGATRTGTNSPQVVGFSSTWTQPTSIIIVSKSYFTVAHPLLTSPTCFMWDTATAL